MKRLLCLLVFIFAALPAFALNKTVTVSNSAIPIVIPGSRVKVIVIQNPSGSAGSINVTLDGSNPTTSTGITVPAGQQLILCFSGASGSGPNIIRAIAVSADVTVQVSTDDTQST